MKFLTSFLILLIFISSIASLATTESDSVIRRKDKIKQKIAEFRAKFLEDQAKKFEASKELMEIVQFFRDEELKTLKDEMNQIKLNMVSDNAIFNDQRSEIKRKIQNIRDSIHSQTSSMKVAENDYNMKMEKLKNRKSTLESLMAEYCEDCDVINKLQLEFEVAKINRQITQLDSEFLEKSKTIEEALKRLKSNGIEKLYHQYSELIDVYEEKLNENDDKNKLNELKNKIVYKWKQYGNNLGAIKSSLQIDLNKLITKAPNYDKITSDIDESAEDDFEVDENTKVFILKGETSENCRVYLGNDNNLYGNEQSCADNGLIPKIIEYKNITYSCASISSDYLKFVYSNCRKVEKLGKNFKVIIKYKSYDAKNEMSYVDPYEPCLNFEQNSNGDLHAVNCSIGYIKIPLDVSFNNENYSCHSMTHDNDNVFFENCMSSDENLEVKLNDAQNLRVFVNNMKIRPFKKYCTNFTLGYDKNLYGLDCYDEFCDFPKIVNFNNQQYKCWRYEYLKVISYYHDCFDYDELKITIDKENEFWAHSEVNKNTKFLVRFNESSSDNNTDLPCTNSLIDHTAANNEIYCTKYIEKTPSAPKVFSYQHEYYTCLSFTSYSYYSYYYNCHELKDTNISDDEINDDLKVYIKMIRKDDKLQSPCSKFILAEDKNLYAAFCHEESISLPKIVTYQSKQFECWTGVNGSQYFKYSDCYRYYNLTVDDINLRVHESDYNDEIKRNTKVFIQKDHHDANVSEGCTAFSLDSNNELHGVNCYERQISLSKIIAYKNIWYKCPSVASSKYYSIYYNCHTIKEQITKTESSGSIDELIFSWIKIHEKSSMIPYNSVLGGFDVDGSSLYVIRVKNSGDILYGKYVHTDTRKNGYVTKDDVEYGAHEFEILTASKYSWCNFDPSKSYEVSLSICRALYTVNNETAMIPGNLLDDGKCRIGYEWKSHDISNDIGILVFGLC